MPALKIIVDASLGNLAQFDAAVRNSARSNVQAIQNANKSIASVVGTVSQGIFDPKTSGAGLFATNIKAVFDGTNRSVIHTGDLIRRTVKDFESVQSPKGIFGLKTNYIDQYESSYKKILGDVNEIEKALVRTGPLEQRILDNQERSLRKQIPLQNKLVEKAAERQRIINQGATAQAPILLSKQLATDEITKYRAQRAAGGAAASIDPLIRAAESKIRTYDQQLARIATSTTRSTDRIDKAVRQVTTSINRLRGSLAGRETVIRRDPSFAALDAAHLAVPPIDAQLASALSSSRDIQKKLLKEGLGRTATGQKTRPDTSEFKAALAAQEAAVTSYTRNASTGLTTLQGHFKNLNTGLLNKFTFDIDKNGKVITRWRGTLSGAGNILRQTVRDFQKVIEWTIATTLVFGTLAAVVGQLSSINELNQSLARLSITAQTSSEDTDKLFSRLGKVAIDTATPLKEIVNAADDIALATRRANQSTEEWQRNIIALTQAVGIYTNLSGVDTVEATDQLSAAFKQLGIAPNEVIGVLNKVTAVAGGQAGAIKDIVSGVSGLAEAARAAGFDIDEQIASIQVLSQVTNKSSDEITTAFKNLFGSVSSVGSAKILGEFGIQIRDAEGGVRDFLDIYRDVRDALDKGVIPRNRLPDVLRGISGGPRRAPDAAALLANLGKIDEVVAKSQGATNEALIANAKILDTNTAKITQFQNAIDIAIYEQLGEAVKSLVSGFTDLGIFLAQGFGGLDGSIIKATLLLVGLLALLKGVRAIDSFLHITSGIKGMGTAIMGAYGNLKAFTSLARSEGLRQSLSLLTPTGGGIVAGLGRNKAALGKLGLAGAIGIGTAGAIAGGTDTNSVGSTLALGGAVLTLIPGLQAVGAAALLAGTAIQLFSGSSQDAKKSEHDLAIELQTLTTNLKASQDAANNYVEAQKKSKKVIDELRDKLNKTSDEQAKLTEATDSFVTATFALAAANKEVSASFQEIIDKIPGLSKEYNDLKELAASGLLGPEQQADLLQRLNKQLLEATGQGAYSTTTPATTSPDYFRNTRVGGRFTTLPGGARGEQFDFNTLRDIPTEVRKLFRITPEGTTVRAPTESLDQYNISAIQGALSKLPELINAGKGEGITKEQVQLMVDALAANTTSIDSFNQNAIALTQQIITVQNKAAIGIPGFGGEAGQKIIESLTLASRVSTLREGFVARQPVGGEGQHPSIPPEIAQSQILIDTINKNAEKGIAPTIDQFIQLSTLAILFDKDLQGLKNTSEETFKKGIYENLKEAGLSAEDLDFVAHRLGISFQVAAEAAQDLAAGVDASIEAAKRSALSSFGDRQLQLIIAENNGEFKNNAAGLKILNDQNQAALDTTTALAESLKTLSEVQIVDLANSLSNVVGLQGNYITATDLASLSTDDATKAAEELTNKLTEQLSKLVAGAVAAGVNAAGIKELKDRFLELAAAITAVPSYKLIIVDIQTRANTAFAEGNTNLGNLKENQASRLRDKQAIIDANNKKEQDDFEAFVKKLLESGKGNTLGQLPKAGGGSKKTAGPDVSTLDIPDELRKLNQQGLLSDSQLKADIQQAYRDAVKLQHTIPGYDKEAKNDIVDVLNGVKNIAQFSGVKQELLRKALDNLADIEKKRLEFETKADTIRRIRVGVGDFSGLVNLPLNKQSGVSVGSPEGPITVNLNMNGQLLTPAQFAQAAEQIAAALKRQIAN